MLHSLHTEVLTCLQCHQATRRSAHRLTSGCMSFRVPKASRRDSRRRSSAAALLIACSSADSGAGGTSGGSGASAGAGAGATTSGGSYQGDYNGCVPGLQREPHVVLGVHRDATRLEVRQVSLLAHSCMAVRQRCHVIAINLTPFLLAVFRSAFGAAGLWVPSSVA